MIKKKRKKDGLHLTDKKHPKQGIASTILGLLSLVLFLVLCILSGQAGGNAGIWIGIWGVVLAVINIWGFVLGMISLKLENIRQLLQEVHPAILRANYGEAAALLGLSAAEHGVDSLTVPIDAAACAKALAQKLGTVVVLSGAEDLVTDGTALHTVSGGSDLMRRVTGAGCMLTVLCGAFAAVQPQAPLQAAVQAAEFWKACAAAAEPQAHGPASFRVALLDAAAQIV